MLQKVWTSLKVSGWIGAAAFVVAVPGYMLSSAHYDDLLAYHDWVDPATVTDPAPGQFYVIDQRGTIKDPLCLVRPEDFEAETLAEGDRQLVNRLGDALPLAFNVVGIFIPALRADGSAADPGSTRHLLELRGLARSYAPASSLIEHNRRVLAPRDLDLMEKDMGAAQFGEQLRLESCAKAIVSSLESDLLVCQLNDVVRLGTSGPVLGVDFASRCLASASDTGPRRLPEFDRGSFLSRLKHRLGLLGLQPLSPAAPTGQI